MPTIEVAKMLATMTTVEEVVRMVMARRPWCDGGDDSDGDLSVVGSRSSFAR